MSVTDDDGFGKEFFDSLAAVINARKIYPEERLVDHSCYFAANIGEIRMCALQHRKEAVTI